MLLAQAAVVVLAFSGFLALLPLIGPMFAGILVTVVTLGLAGLLAWLAVRMLKVRK